MPYTFEYMSEEHRRPVLDILNTFVAHSFAAYPQALMGYDLFDRFMNTARGYPSAIVRDESGNVVGFAFLHPYHFAGTLARKAEITSFILPEHTRKGLGTAILQRFITEARDRRVDTIVATICLRNTENISFHGKNGVRKCGRLRNVGQDFDILWMQLHLRGSIAMASPAAPDSSGRTAAGDSVTAQAR